MNRFRNRYFYITASILMALVVVLVCVDRPVKAERKVVERIAAGKEAELSTVIYAASRVDPDVKFTDAACQTLVKVPRVFLKAALQGCVDWAKENGVSVLDVEQMAIIRDKRGAEKKK